MPQNLVFDIGNVLLRWDPDLLYRKLIADEAERAVFFRDILPPEWNMEQDRGRPWPEAEALQIARFPAHEALIRAYRLRWHDMAPELIEKNVAVLAAAHARGIPCYAITNFAADTFAEVQTRFPVLSSFDGIIVSGKERLIKPDPAIFELFLERFALKAADCLFMDDSEANVATADAMGFGTVRVLDDTDLFKEISRHNIIL